LACIERRIQKSGINGEGKLKETADKCTLKDLPVCCLIKFEFLMQVTE